MGLRPFAQSFQNRPQSGASFSELESVVARQCVAVHALDQT